MAEAGPGDGVAGGGPGMTAWRLGARFVEGDAHHPPANVAKMARGEPLDDADRAPWLAALACSALEADYRHILAAGGEVVFVHLTGAEGLIAERLAARRDHDMPPSLLASQLRTLQPPGPNERAGDHRLHRRAARGDRRGNRTAVERKPSRLFHRRIRHLKSLEDQRHIGGRLAVEIDALLYIRLNS